MITDELKLEISDFSDWCSKNQYLTHYKYATQLFDKDKASKIHNEFQKVIDSYPLPDDIYMMGPEDNGIKYLSLNSYFIDEDVLINHLHTKDDPEKEFYRIKNKFTVAIPYFKFRFADIIEKNLDSDIIASIINERIKQGLTIEELAEKAQIEISLLNKIETRKQTPSLRILCKIVNALNKHLKLI
jgi:DNA-binding helix-turn-helix protein